MKWPSATERRRWLSALAFVAGAAWAQYPDTTPERWLAVEEAGVAARARLFELARIVLPVCTDDVTWTLGPLPYHVAMAEPSHEPSKRIRQAVIDEFAAAP